MTTYIEVPAAALDAFLTSKKFESGVVGAETVYYRTSKSNPAIRIAVYSSVKDGDDTARACGEDAIRVVLLGTVGPKKEWCLHKTKRIHRTGSVDKVLARVLDRVLEAAEVAKGYGGPCKHCAAPTYSDSGRCIVKICRETKH